MTAIRTAVKFNEIKTSTQVLAKPQKQVQINKFDSLLNQQPVKIVPVKREHVKHTVRNKTLHLEKKVIDTQNKRIYAYKKDFSSQ